MQEEARGTNLLYCSPVKLQPFYAKFLLAFIYNYDASIVDYCLVGSG